VSAESATPLSAYLDDVQRHPLLTRDEELELTRRYAEQREPADGRRLVTSNLRLVVKVARDYQQGRVPLIDLIQEGNLGLLHAVEKFDPAKEVRFSTYSVWWIRAYVLRYLMQNHSLVRMGTSKAQRKLFYNLRKEAARLEADGIRPTARRIAANLEVQTAEVVLMQGRMAGGEVSFEAPVGSEEDGRSLADVLTADGPTVEEWATRAEIRARIGTELDRFADGLEARRRRIWDLRTRADEPMTLRAVGAEIGVSGERVRLIEARILRELRRHLQVAFPDLDVSDFEALGQSG
jgi:RNA polymerase sigma-32 factor